MSRIDALISVIAPLRNAETVVEPFLRELSAVLAQHYSHYEIVLVDDGSTDNTVGRVSTLLHTLPCIRLVRLSRSFGTDIAITSGLESAIGDYIVTLIPDTDPVTLIPDLVEQCRQGKDLLFGVTAQSTGSLTMRAATWFFYRLAKSLFRLDILEHATYYQVFSRQALNAIIRIKDKTRYLRLLGTFVGYDNRTFTYSPIHRSLHQTERTWNDALRLAVGLLTAHSTNPLRFVSLLGLFSSLLILLYIGYVLVIYFFKDHVAEGWTTLSLQTAGLFFLVFMILAVLSEYIGQILAELKDRPLYLTLEEKNSSVLSSGPERRNVTSTSE